MQDLTPPEMSAFRYRVMTRVAHFVYFFIKGMTVGVRAACFDREGRVFLVRHSYIPGWHMPGGGVERRETVREALIKELREEGNLELTRRRPCCMSITTAGPRSGTMSSCIAATSSRPRHGRGITRSWNQGFFPLDALPEGTTSATRRRLAELSGETAFDDLW